MGAAGLGLAARTAGAATSAELPAFDAAKPHVYWEAVRALYPLAPDLKYFNTGGLGPAAAPAAQTRCWPARRVPRRPRRRP